MWGDMSVGLAGFEPATSLLGGERSVRLNYRPKGRRVMERGDEGCRLGVSGV
jgi:hypothetical protein